MVWFGPNEHPDRHSRQANDEGQILCEEHSNVGHRARLPVGANVSNGSKADVRFGWKADIWNVIHDLRVLPSMAQEKLYDEATEVTVKDDEVILNGPDAVDVKVTPEAAEETADNLIEGSVEARGQRRLKDLLHKPR